MKRQFLRAWKDIRIYGYLPYFRARKLIAYKGWIKNSNSKNVIDTYQLDDLFGFCGQVISKVARKEKEQYDQRMLQIATISG